MKYTKIDIDNWPRKKHFAFFKELDMPFFNITGQINVTKLKNKAKTNNQSFTLSFLHLLLTELNKIDDFRIRVIDNMPVILDKINVGATVEGASNTFLYSRLEHNDNIYEFIKNALIEIDLTIKKNELNPNNAIDLIYFTSIPWVSYTHISHAKSLDKTDFIPRFAIGKYTHTNNEYIIPLSIEVNHAVCDGYHVGQLFQNVQKAINEISE